ncbi:glycosyltransferase family 2 protein [Tamlana sp. 2201CG12-4]|uniref:glycosyltransferase family 2 protein n=1 Tax=Tamlana sp. 2201CG12-4 TaxID=3112582 RepID=UPI002DB95A00|nr:glycosyltransferase family 2 protein [Tamlana sp. 2201CG12-4]MEC3907337.1 glycosyltransferase family 2 protein [Tamlana sp. 2201CG12-4]
MIKSPLVSIIVPCYNQGKFLNDALTSIYNQTYANWECIIVNDGSVDGSERIANKWVHKDDRFKYFFKENSGVSATRNFALDNAKGAYVQFLDADDVIDCRKLELSIDELGRISSEDKTIVFTNFEMFSDNPDITKAPYCRLDLGLFTYENLLYKWNDTFSIPIHCGFFEASLFNNIRFPENLTAQEDWLVWVKMFKLVVTPVFLDKPLALYRQNPQGRTKSRSIIEDQMLVFDAFKEILNEEEFYKLSRTLVERYFKIQRDYKTRFNTLKRSYPYQTGLMIKKVLKSIGMLKLARKIFPFFLRFKS